MIEQRLRNLIVSGFGTRLQKEGELIRVVSKENGEEHTVLVTPHGLEQVIISGECSITSGFVRLLIENNVDLVFVEHRPTKFFARVVRNDFNMVTEVWRKQIMMPPARRVEIGREITDTAIYNKIRLLQMLAKNRNIDLQSQIEHLNRARAALKQSTDTGSLIGIEGDATQTYYSAIRKVIPKKFKFLRREKHPPRDPVNSILSYGYTVLASRVEYGIMLAGLNPYEGIVHSTYRNRQALGFDLIEEFRQPIVDRVVLTQIVQKQIVPDDFEDTKRMCIIKETPKKAYLEALYSRLESKHSYNGEKIPFLDIIFRQAKKLALAISENAKYIGFKWR